MKILTLLQLQGNINFPYPGSPWNLLRSLSFAPSSPPVLNLPKEAAQSGPEGLQPGRGGGSWEVENLGMFEVLHEYICGYNSCGQHPGKVWASMFFGTRQSTMINYIVTKEAGGWQWSVEPFSGFQKLYFFRKLVQKIYPPAIKHRNGFATSHRV